ncbi:hypothetical protein NDU88_000045 [Pleurodeles waltl]|uniref:Uncharacterized protein n=1 Tax=Pleurodeles waltl TaxID=8319 RepID=A0AAV7U2B9_PLEWA|nr:hypothetical protein NDU88_000045 [Pleurodeles waltl]
MQQSSPGPTRPRSPHDHQQHGCAPKEAPAPQSVLPPPKPLSRPRPRTTASSPGPKEAAQARHRPRAGPRWGVHQQPTPPAHLSSFGPSPPPPGQQRLRSSTSAGLLQPAAPIYAARATPHSTPTPPRNQAQRDPAHAAPVRAIHDPAPACEPLFKSGPAPSWSKPSHTGGRTGPLPPRITPDKQGAARSLFSSRLPCLAAWPRPTHHWGPG